MDVTKRYFTTLISVACLAAGTPALAQPADGAAKAKSGQTEKGGAPGQPAAMAGPPGAAGARGAGAGGGRGGGQAQPVEVTNLTRRDLAETVTVVGSLAPNEFAVIRPESTGLVRGIYFEEGQQVKQGDLLMKIDDAELRARVGEAGRRRVVERWSWKHCAQLTVDQYREVLEMPENRAKLAATGVSPC
jgi:multidrug efflux pump subunit AcrA (membrane-fusion protein)